ncbi:MAG: peptidoglycan-binding protein LysM [Firmicutes bacterium HGW-Firmicutes-1]|nr:MAG: peptidoglycan-binding protein LysM [Firmicutes bacterium HGW-Firmicutes-1]
MKKRFKKFLILAATVSILGTNTNYAATYEVQHGDSYWKISQRFGVNLSQLMKLNQANEQAVLYSGNQIKIPDGDNYFIYEVKSGDTPWLLSKKYGISLQGFLKFNGLSESSVINIGQKLRIPIQEPSFSPNQTSTVQISSPNITTPINPAPKDVKITVTYLTHTIKAGDNFWSLGVKYGIPTTELMRLNKATTSTVLSIGQQVSIPIYQIPKMDVVSSNYGEYLDWWTAVQYLIPIGAEFKIIDFYTGKSFMAKRTIGANHADVETLTANDTKIMREIWGGSFSWTSRPVIIEYQNRRVAASVSGMPHAGNDYSAGGVQTSWRSDAYGAGPNYDYIKGNDMHGHFDIHYKNSTRHKDGLIDQKHQENIKTAAGMK